jgi:hypothetical protein
MYDTATLNANEGDGGARHGGIRSWCCGALVSGPSGSRLSKGRACKNAHVGVCRARVEANGDMDSLVLNVAQANDGLLRCGSLLVGREKLRWKEKPRAAPLFEGVEKERHLRPSADASAQNREARRGTRFAWGVCT